MLRAMIDYVFVNELAKFVVIACGYIPLVAENVFCLTVHAVYFLFDLISVHAVSVTLYI